MAEELNTDPANPGAVTPSGVDIQKPDEALNTEPELKPEEKKQLTQEDLDRLAAKVRREEREKHEKAEQDKYATQLKELEDLRKEKEDRETARREAELKRAQEKGDFEKQLEIQNKHHAEALKTSKEQIDSLTAKLVERDQKLAKVTIDNTLLSLLATRSVKPEAAAKLIKDEFQIKINPDTDELTVNGDTSTSLSEVVDTFLKNNAYLDKSNYAGKSGGGSTPGGDKPQTTGNTFTTSQMADMAFYKEHQAEIDKAVSEGRIVEG